MRDALQRYRIGYVSEDRKQEGLILTHSVERNVAITIWRRIGRMLGWICLRRGQRQRRDKERQDSESVGA